MDPALQELLDAGETHDEVAVVVRLREVAPPPGLRIVARLGPIATARVERAAIWQIYGHPAIASLKAPRWLVSEYGPLIDREDAERVDATDTDQRRPDDLAETGRGVLVGVIDWGCDFAHPDFVDGDGVSRVQALWDQRAEVPDGNSYGYGRVLRRGDLTAALKADDPYTVAGYHPARSDTGVGAHGTHVMGIALGNGRGGGPMGLAPGADCAFVHLGMPGWEKAGPLGDSSNLLEALHFLVAEAGDRPLAINMSIGRHAGPHDGSTLVEQAIDWLVRARPGTAVVQSTGNYFARNVHSAGQLINGESDDLSFEVYAGDTTPNELEVWYPGRDVFRAALVAPDGRRIAEAAQNDKVPLVRDGVRIGTLYHRARDPNNGDHHINLFLYPNAPVGTWRLVLTGEDVSDGRYHAWLERDPGCRTCQSLFAPRNADYTATTGSICNGQQTIAVGAYDAHHPDHPIASFSSSGPTRDGRVRPVLLAPGVRVLSARSHPRKGTAALLTRMSGTSMAAPHVTGTLALMLEAGGLLDIVRLRRALFDSLAPVTGDAVRDRDRCGFGVLDTTAAVKRAAELSRTAAPPPLPPSTPSLPAVPPPTPTPAAAASDATPAQAEAELPVEGAPESLERAPTSGDTPMNADCCGDPCKDCKHCEDHDCATCPCCHDGTLAHPNAAAAQFEADQPTVQVVPSPLGNEAWSDSDDAFATEDLDVEVASFDTTKDEAFATDDSEFELDDALALEADESGEPLVQVVPSPLATSREDVEDAFPHPVEAAEALVVSRASDTTRFVADALTASGRAWPTGATVRTLYDDMSRGIPSRRLAMERHFEVVGRPGRPLGMALRSGDLVIRRGDGGFAHGAFVAHPVLYRESEAGAHGLLLEGPWPGWYAHVVEPGVRPRQVSSRFARRLVHADGSVLDDTLILRPRDGDGIAAAWADAAEFDESSASDDVRWLQGALNRAISAGLVVDGIVGPATRDAIRRYQTARGLLVDGIAGPQTLGALRTEGYAPPPNYTPLSGYTPTPPPPSYPAPSPTPSYPTEPPTEPDPAYPPPSRYETPPTPYTPPPPYVPPPRYERPPYTPPTPYTPPPPYVPPPRYERPPYTPPRRPPPSRPYVPPRPPTYEPPKPPPYQPPAYKPPPSYTPPAYTTPTRSYKTQSSATLRFSFPDLADGENVGTCSAVDRFGYDSDALTTEHRTAIAALAGRMTTARSTAATITGYASPEGTASYNLALGQRRADAVAGELRQALERIRAGSAASVAITARSEGEARQLGPDAASNRRVEVCYNEGPRPAPRPQPRPRPRPQVLVRHDVASTQGQAMLRRYEEAVRRMSALPEGNPLSWTFQWYVHAIRSDRSKSGELTRLYGSAPSALRTLADRTWNTCRPHFGADEEYFLAWHRMYVYYFERICRRVLQDDAFTLPYWDYSSGDSALPALFRNPSSPLYRAARTTAVNNGGRIDQNQPQGTLSPNDALRETRFSAPGDADESAFNDMVELRPHNLVHGLIGNDTRGMGTVDWAAQDPIFWLHHCNIDRLWASWNAAGRANPTTRRWLDQAFPFANEDGQLVNAVTRDFTGTTARGYRYDRLVSVPRGGTAEWLEADTPTRARRTAMATRHIAAPAGGIRLGGDAIRVTLPRSSGESSEADEATGPARRTYLVLRNYRASAGTGVIYHVYLSLPPGTRGADAQRHYVGPLSFFGAVPLPGHGGTHAGRTARFDVTRIVQRLRAAGLAEGTTPSVTIAPAGRPSAAAQPVIGEISLVEK